MRKAKKMKSSQMQKHPNVNICVKNFGPIAKATIDLSPLTVFVGPSNTGKTYFSTLIYALQGVFNGFPQFSHRFMNLMHMTYMEKYEKETKKEISSMLKKLNTIDRPFKFSDLPQVVRDNLHAEINDPKPITDELKRCFDLNSISELIRLTDGQREKMEISIQVSDENQSIWDCHMQTSDSDLDANGQFNSEAIMQFRDSLGSKSLFDLGDLITGLGLGFAEFSEKRYYLPAARSGIMQSHRVIASSLVERAGRGGLSPLEVPTFSGIVADFMKRLILYEESQAHEAVMKPLADEIESNLLVGQIITKVSPSGYPDFLYCPQDTGEEVRLTRAASMVSELAPIVLLLRSNIHPNDMLIIEEPEAHLHPGAQTQMALTLAALIRAGIRVIVTTHSDWLLKEIANLIRIGKLKKEGVSLPKTIGQTDWLLPEEVGAWWFQKNDTVRHIPFDSTEGIEPKDYEDVAYKLYDRSVNLQDLLEEIEGGK